MTDVTDVIRQVFAAYHTGDRTLIDGLLDDRLTFTSPYDDHIDKATYFERCWPNRDKIRAHNLEKIFVQGEEAFVRYEAEATTGVRFRNTEYFRLENGKVVEIEVYFGQK